MGLDTKTDWPTGLQSERDFDLMRASEEYSEPRINFLATASSNLPYPTKEW
jgi:hypothetical protein